ncbi:MAG TPA: hypothetical protein P5120_16165 [Spirochaetota bacterium]|nr:hypothetical protein [Spirochaetota bacterium]HPF08078.1 hypothetical protein [Spirochaetota bacterium]HPJ44296.1 hypothetical protein [Spirochaetota bacterium]HPR39354.1 hypothetical protein [Spirochaetota bacterium]HRX49055.1 hypothetical protein [Spirochaetota bacterium]
MMIKKIILFLLIPAMIIPSCKDKKEHPMVDIESINYDGSRDDRYIFREELKKEQEKKERLDKLQKEME